MILIEECSRRHAKHSFQFFFSNFFLASNAAVVVVVGEERERERRRYIHLYVLYDIRSLTVSHISHTHTYIPDRLQ